VLERGKTFPSSTGFFLSARTSKPFVSTALDTWEIPSLPSWRVRN